MCKPSPPSSLSSSSHFSSQLIPPPSLLPLSCFPLRVLLFLLFPNQQASFSSSCHRYAPSLSGDPFDVVRHYEIMLHLGQFSVWWLILHEPISRAFQHSRIHLEHMQMRKLHLFISKENEIRWVPHRNTHTQTQRNTHRGHPYCAVLLCRQVKRWKASWLLSFRTRIICWEGGSGWFGCVDN